MRRLVSRTWTKNSGMRLTLRPICYDVKRGASHGLPGYYKNSCKELRQVNPWRNGASCERQLEDSAG